jgi:hypothetical protein
MAFFLKICSGLHVNFASDTTGLLGPYMIGVAKQATGGYAAATMALAFVAAMTAVIAFAFTEPPAVEAVGGTQAGARRPDR